MPRSRVREVGGSNPVAPICFRQKTFGEEAEGFVVSIPGVFRACTPVQSERHSDKGVFVPSLQSQAAKEVSVVQTVGHVTTS